MEWLKIIGISFTMISIGFIILRVVAKRNFSEMSPFHIFLVLMLTNILSEPIKTDHFAEIIIPTLVIVFSFFLYSYLQTSNRLSKGIKAKPIVLVRHGNIDEKALSQAKITLSEMLAELRVKGYSHVQDVEFAILEETGKLSVIPNSSKRPLTPSDISYVPSYEGLPVPLIMDGVILYDNLAKIKMSPKELLNRLSLQGYDQQMIKTISLAVLDERNNLIIDQNDDTNQGNIAQQQQTIWSKIYEDMHAQRKSPEEKDLGIVDDYIKPKP
ncbi:DUF421 domain-containing protein [Tepidibacillus fermentans]|uniref:Uncharacterized membrane protein YcaP (DUF421 family) n=1 Tax=Tepidibacillus fermentans TaxID=1281767 RepID=A0A4R3KGW5_9BACI|nr:DUF421 domain-containing protein [Tepidibacillus fermentans]TCS82588.1 uncharacterized membrane protein YcaP (DUF421 family) [Tepidibacillus fermentans]